MEKKINSLALSSRNYFCASHYHNGLRNLLSLEISLLWGTSFVASTIAKEKPFLLSTHLPLTCRSNRYKVRHLALFTAVNSATRTANALKGTRGARNSAVVLKIDSLYCAATNDFTCRAGPSLIIVAYTERL